MIHNIVLSYPNINLECIYHFREVMGDAIIYNFTVDGLDLTGATIRGEVYDLNTSIRMVNDPTLTLPGVSPQIVVTDAKNGKFTATVATGQTATMQQYGCVEFSVWDAHGNKFTLMQQAIAFTFERIVWNTENQNVQGNYDDEGTGEDPLF
jgi:acyl-CoA reductase-like NAD-dependent aldehyde dehydrogenase